MVAGKLRLIEMNLFIPTLDFQQKKNVPMNLKRLWIFLKNQKRTPNPQEEAHMNVGLKIENEKGTGLPMTEEEFIEMLREYYYDPERQFPPKDLS